MNFRPGNFLRCSLLHVFTSFFFALILFFDRLLTYVGAGALCTYFVTTLVHGRGKARVFRLLSVSKHNPRF